MAIQRVSHHQRRDPAGRHCGSTRQARGLGPDGEWGGLSLTPSVLECAHDHRK
jgi:hypothetical protein